MVCGLQNELFLLWLYMQSYKKNRFLRPVNKRDCFYWRELKKKTFCLHSPEMNVCMSSYENI